MSQNKKVKSRTKKSAKVRAKAVRVPKGSGSYLEMKTPNFVMQPGLSIGGLSDTQYIAPFPRTYFRTQAYNDPKTGVKDGIRYSYCAPVLIATSTIGGGNMTTWAYYNTAYSNSTIAVTAGVGTGAIFNLNPWTCLPSFVGPKTDPMSYSRFAFRKFKLHWMGNVNSSTNAAVGMCYNPDGAVVVGDFSYTTYWRNACAGSMQTWSHMTLDCTDFINQRDWYYTDYDTTTEDAGWRESYQGAAIVYPNPAYCSINTSAVDFGQVWIEAEMLLAEPMQSVQDIAGPLSAVEQRRRRHHGFRNRLVATQGVEPEAPQEESKSRPPRGREGSEEVVEPHSAVELDVPPPPILRPFGRGVVAKR